MPPWLNLVLRLSVTAALLAYALKGVDWPKFTALLLQADWRWWAVGLVTGMLVQAVAGVRWAALARPLGFDFSRRFFVWRFFEGMFFSLCLPSSIGGDVIKAYRIGDTTSRRLLAGCSVLADRLTGLSALAVLGGAAFASRKYDLSLPVTLAVATVLLVVALAVFLLAVSFLDRIVAMLPDGSPVRGFLAQLLPYQQRPSLIAKAVAWSFVVQAGGALGVMWMPSLPMLMSRPSLPLPLSMRIGNSLPRGCGACGASGAAGAAAGRGGLGGSGARG